MRNSTVSELALLRKHLSSRSSLSIALSVIVGLTIALIALIPRGMTQLADAEVRYQLNSLPPGTSDLFASGTSGLGQQTAGANTMDELYGPTEAVLSGVPDGFSSPLGDLLDTGSWVAMLGSNISQPEKPQVGTQIDLNLGVDLAWRDKIRIVAGSAPASWDGDPADPIHIAIPVRLAALSGLIVGDRLGYETAPLEVSAIYEPVDLDDSYWTHVPELLTPTSTVTSSALRVIRSGAFIDPLTAASLPSALSRANLRAWYPMRIDAIPYANVTSLQAQLRRAGVLGVELPSGERLVFSTDLDAALDHITASVATANALLALTASAPFGALAAVLVQGIRAVVARRETMLALSAARGASLLQLRVTLLAEGVLVSLPSAIGAVAIVSAVAPGSLDWPVVPYLVLIVLAVPAAFLFTGAEWDLHARAGAAHPRWRWISEVATAGIAAVALYLLISRGLVTTSSAQLDPLLVATPLLLATVLSLVVMRVYPLAVRGLRRAARNASGPVALVGTTRTTPVGSVAALVIGVSAAVVSLVLWSTLAAAVTQTAHAAVGADIRIVAEDSDPAAVSRVAGVDAVVGLDVEQGIPLVVGNDTIDVDVVFANLSALEVVRPDIPDVHTLSSGTPVLVSSDIAQRVQAGSELNGAPVSNAGAVSVGAIPGVRAPWVLVDSSAKDTITGTTGTFDAILVSAKPGADIHDTASRIGSALNEVNPNVEGAQPNVTDIETTSAALHARPGLAGLNWTLLVGTVLCFVLCLGAVALAALAASAARSRGLGVLRLLGMSRSQLRLVLVWELAPPPFAAIVSGVGFGLGMAVLIANVVDLGAVVGGTISVAPSVPWGSMAGLLVAFATMIAATSVVAMTAARRVGASTAVRMGEE
jgi:putative ABC transport system permease protein